MLRPVESRCEWFKAVADTKYIYTSLNSFQHFHAKTIPQRSLFIWHLIHSNSQSMVQLVICTPSPTISSQEDINIVQWDGFFHVLKKKSLHLPTHSVHSEATEPSECINTFFHSLFLQLEQKWYSNIFPNQYLLFGTLILRDLGISPLLWYHSHPFCVSAVLEWNPLEITRLRYHSPHISINNSTLSTISNILSQGFEGSHCFSLKES